MRDGIDARGRWTPPFKPLATMLYCCAVLAIALEYLHPKGEPLARAALGVVGIGFFFIGLGFHVLSRWIARRYREEAR